MKLVVEGDPVREPNWISTVDKTSALEPQVAPRSCFGVIVMLMLQGTRKTLVNKKPYRTIEKCGSLAVVDCGPGKVGRGDVRARAKHGGGMWNKHPGLPRRLGAPQWRVIAAKRQREA